MTIGALLLFVLFYRFVFLRDNGNRIPEGDSIVAPASGKIVHIEEISPGKASLDIKKGFFGFIRTEIPNEAPYILINIFMNVTDVHFTKAPCRGKVVEIVRRPGRFRSVFSIREAIENEKQEIILETDFGIVKVIQIAGFLARRCVSFVRVGDSFDKGAKLGQILLGSQIALLIPKHDLTLKVAIGDKVSSGETVLLEY